MKRIGVTYSRIETWKHGQFLKPKFATASSVTWQFFHANWQNCSRWTLTDPRLGSPLGRGWGKSSRCHASRLGMMSTNRTFWQTVIYIFLHNIHEFHIVPFHTCQDFANCYFLQPSHVSVFHDDRRTVSSRTTRWPEQWERQDWHLDGDRWVEVDWFLPSCFYH